jgi:hypothetical protein
VEKFDIVVVADVLEHLLRPEELVSRLAAECRSDTRVVVHVPWKESLAQYEEVPYEFVHMRSFGEYTFRELFHDFEIVRERDSLPRIDEPVVFRLKRFLPRRAYELLVGAYFTTGLHETEYRHRERWIRELPARERWLLKLYEPTCKLFELRRRPAYSRAAAFVRGVRRAVTPRAGGA